MTRSITLDGTPRATTAAADGATVAAGALPAGKYAPSDTKVAKKGKWKSYKIDGLADQEGAHERQEERPR